MSQIIFSYISVTEMDVEVELPIKIKTEPEDSTDECFEDIWIEPEEMDVSIVKNEIFDQIVIKTEKLDETSVIFDTAAVKTEPPDFSLLKFENTEPIEYETNFDFNLIKLINSEHNYSRGHLSSEPFQSTKQENFGDYEYDTSN